MRSAKRNAHPPLWLVIGAALLAAGCPEEVKSPSPTLTGVAPALICNDQLTTTVTLTGSGLSPVVTGALTDEPVLFVPDLRLERAFELDGSPAVARQLVDIDESEAAGRVRWLTQAQMELDVDPSLALPPGIYDVSVGNLDGRTATLPGALVVVPPPRLDEVVPTPICTEQFDNELTLNGAGFLVIDGVAPQIRVGGLTLSPERVEDCFMLGGPTPAESCNRLVVVIEQDALPAGDYPVTVVNPAPANCESAESITLSIVPPPTVTSVQPATICSTGSRFTVTGEDFRENATVFVGSSEAMEVTFVDATLLDVRMGANVEPGIHDVTVVNADGCEDTLAAAIEVVPGPILFFVDPPVVYQGVNTQASLLVGGLTGEVVRVAVEEVATGEVTDLAFEYDPDTDDNIVLAIVPAGLTEGSYHVFLEEDTSCVPLLENALFVEADLTVALASVAPSFGWTEADTAIDLRATDPAPAGTVQFEEIPRVYLNPGEPGVDTVATALRSVSFSSPTRLSAVVPDGLTPDVYDVIVVNRSGSIGLLAAAFTVTAEDPPVIDAVSPIRVSASTDTAVTIQGANFRSPTAGLTCATGAGGTESASFGVTGDGTTLTGTVPSSTLTQGSVCVVRVTNDDGSFFDYSAISVGSPSGNLFGFEDGPDLTTGRRAPAAVAGRATPVARYLYAIGGDDGTEAGAISSIEAAALDSFGALAPWRPLPGALPAPRTLAGVALLDRFVYLIAGNDGSGPTATVLRAQVLDPRAAPDFADLGFDFGEGEGLGGGTWVYRISAVFDVSDPINPGGESLASDPIVVRLPDLESRIHLTLAWTAVVDAVGYRVYRSPEAEAGSNTEELLAEVEGGDSLSFTDTGDTTDAVAARPLPPGALGEWASVATLATAREGACVAAARDPDTAGSWFVYVAGGRGAGATVLDSIEILAVSRDGRDQTVASPVASGATLSSPRWQCGGYTVDSTFHSVVGPNESWIYFGAGRTTGEALDANADAGEVGPDGELGCDGDTGACLDPVAARAQAGYGVASASDFLYMFGGFTSGGVDDRGFEAEIDGPPDLSNWNAQGGASPGSDVALPGSAQESAVIFIIGGQTNGSMPPAVTNATIFTNF